MPNPSSSGPGHGRPPRVIAVRWLFAAALLLLASTWLAWTQAPGPVPMDRATAPFSFWLPLEANPHRRLPKVYETLYALHFTPDGKRGWAVGKAGRILATHDGGISWTAQASPVARQLDLVIFDEAGQHGWAGSREAVFVATEDGGRSWKADGRSWDTVRTETGVDIRPRVPPVFPLPGEQRTLSRDILKYWSNSTMDVSRVDALSVWRIQGLRGTLEHSRDNGESWQEIAKTPYLGLEAIHMTPDGLHGWAAGLDGVLIATTDAWKTWHPQTASAAADLNGLWLHADGARAWTVGANGRVMASANGGRDWFRQASPVTNRLNAVAFDADGLHGWAGGERGVLITTSDGGRTWSRRESGATADIIGLHMFAQGSRGWIVDKPGARLELGAGNKWTRLEPGWSNGKVPRSISMKMDGKHGWAVNDPAPEPLWSQAGELLGTDDGGRSWHAVPADMPLTAVAMGGTAPRGYGIASILQINGPGEPVTFFANVLATTNDAGATWRPSPHTLTRNLYAVSSTPDAMHVLVVGKSGAILATEDGGKTWDYAEHYRRYPAPWYWLAVLLSSALVWLAWARRPGPATHLSVSSMAASDAEVRGFNQDRLNFAGLARGISRFLRNAKTQPPLTLAITGAWGTGKSSLMRLVSADMHRFKHRPIWFNAWHHQKEEHLFAALLGAIYTQAAPPLLSINGLGFRLRLLWLRSRGHFGLVLLALAGISAACAFSSHALAEGGLGQLTASVHALGDNLELATGALAGLAAALTALVAIVKGATPLRINPAVLLGAAHKHMSLKLASDQIDFRERFARQFGEVTQALPYKMVVIIDDLDRCRPAAVIEVMETVNYLTSAGECFVLFGMAKERVIAALGLAFKDIAAELVQMERGTPGVDGDASDEERELAKRRAYAADYLQKLVNIEIKVPATEEARRGLLAPVTQPPVFDLRSLAGKLAAMLPVAACAAAVLIGIGAAGLGQERMPPAAAQPATTVATDSTPTPAAGAAPTGAERGGGVAQPPAPARRMAIEPGERTTSSANLQWIGAACLLVFSTAALVGIRILRQSVVTTWDSLEFQGALQIWVPVVAAYRPTPRSIKRFCNRLRYLAMLQQSEEDDKTVLDMVRERFARWRGRRVARGYIQRPKALSEQQLIALGTMYEVFGEAWRDELMMKFPPGWRNAAAQHGQETANMALMRDAANKHCGVFGVSWPPEPAELDVFALLISGVRLAGDPVPIRTNERSQSAHAGRTYGPSSQSARPSAAQGGAS